MWSGGRGKKLLLKEFEKRRKWRAYWSGGALEREAWKDEAGTWLPIGSENSVAVNNDSQFTTTFSSNISIVEEKE